MTNSEEITLDLKPQTESYPTVKISSSSRGGMLLSALKVIESILLSFFFAIAIIIFLLKDDRQAVIFGIISLSIAFVLLLINRQVFQDSEKAAYQASIANRAELYDYLAQATSIGTTNLVPAREKALIYCQELIDDYKKTRGLSRNFYYLLQITTVVFSGVTPILVLVDKLEAGQAWLKWLPVIFPAIASIIASIATSFPFQKNWLAANATVELLEAEQEKFILGITSIYRCYDVADETQKQQKAIQAIEAFIVQVNNIHLKQVQQSDDKQQQQQQQSSDNRNDSNQSSDANKAST
ncbi:hypothetical protein BCD67_18345 [Oscillatoriales cyanobacterium USR001]|nr:hypothetical protein BCD67_18345 [Oscillatoriales cyanobacterium USR001]